MINERVDIEVFGRKMSVEMEGLTPLEVQSIAAYVSEKMRDVARESNIVDSSKLAILAALEIAAELHKQKSQLENFTRIEEKKIEGMIVSMNAALGAGR